MIIIDIIIIVIVVAVVVVQFLLFSAFREKKINYREIRTGRINCLCKNKSKSTRNIAREENKKGS